MTKREELFELVCREMIVGVVREDSSDDAMEIARAFFENGIRIVEITFTTPDAVSLIARLNRLYRAKGMVVAAGTIRSGNDAADARRAGAQILVAPHTDLRVLEYAVEHDLVCVAGAATATEIIRAWDAGASLVKIYPARHLGGPDFIRTVRGPIRDVAMLAGGPVDLDEIETYLDAGVRAVNLGPSLAVPQLVREKQWDEIGKRAATAVATVSARRSVRATVTLN